ncbi:hypothetical protein Ae201684_004830 [Aphanomyces euteiches]|nr:hypothetical protein Ae201684_004830 [Aphanomyces euteiches]
MFKYKGKRTLPALAAFARAPKDIADAMPIPSAIVEDTISDDLRKRNSSSAMPLSDLTFDDMLKVDTEMPWLLVLYTPPLPDLVEDLASLLKGNITVGRINVDSEKCIEVVARFRSFDFSLPAILAVSHGQMHRYVGEFSADPITAFATGGFKENPVLALPENDDSSDVVDLNATTFDELTSNNGTWLIAFHTPKCTQCKRLIPLLTKVATDLKADEDIHVGKVDSPSTALKKRFGLREYPTLIVLSNGSTSRYVGQHTQEGLAAYARGGYLLEPENAKSTLPERFDIVSGRIATIQRWAQEDSTTLGILLMTATILGLVFGLFIGGCCSGKHYDPRPKYLKRD